MMDDEKRKILARIGQLERDVRIYAEMVIKLGEAAKLQQTVLQGLCIATGVTLEVGTTQPAAGKN